jgi:branched-chain amino acid transport system substrate-binding protein
MSVGYTFVEALLAAGEELTRSSIVAAVEKGGFEGPGLTPFRYSGTDHSGYSGLQMGRTSGGEQLPFGPVYVTDEGDGPVTEHTGEPANGIPTA